MILIPVDLLQTYQLVPYYLPHCHQLIQKSLIKKNLEEEDKEMKMTRTKVVKMTMMTKKGRMEVSAQSNFSERRTASSSDFQILYQLLARI